MPPNGQDARQDMNQDDVAAQEMDFSTVVVVARSPVNRIVLAKIIERASLKAVVEQPETAAAVLRSHVPGVVVLDGGVDNRECEQLSETIAAARCAGGGTLPAVGMLSSRVGTPRSLGLPDIVDVVVAKPITPEKSQPGIERLIAMARA